MGFVVKRSVEKPEGGLNAPPAAYSASQVRRRSKQPSMGYPGKVAIRRAGEAARALGLAIGVIEISPDGTIRVLDRGTLPAQSNDEFAVWFPSDA